MFPRRTKKLAELEAERAERERDANTIEYLRQSDKVSGEVNYGAADVLMAIFGFTRVKDNEQ